MQRFKNFCEERYDHQEFLDEGLRSFMKRVRTSLYGILGNLSVGKTTTINIPFSRELFEGVDTSKRKEGEMAKRPVQQIGYLHEWLIIRELSALLSKKGFKVYPDKRTDNKIQEYQKFIESVVYVSIPVQKRADEGLKRAISGATIAARRVAQDFISLDDIVLCDSVHITHTGASTTKRNDKADLAISIKMKDANQIREVVAASIKVGSGQTNHTFVSTTTSTFMNRIYFNGNMGKGRVAVSNMLHAMSEIPALKPYVERATAAYTSNVGSDGKGYLNVSREDRYQNYNHIRDLVFIHAFNYYYKKNKRLINERMLHYMGFEKSEAVYATVGKISKLSTLSNGPGSVFSSIISGLYKDMNIKFVPMKGASTKMVIHVDGAELIKINMNPQYGDDFKIMGNMKKFLK